MEIDEFGDLFPDDRLKQIRQQRKEKRLQEINDRRKRSKYYPLLNRFQHLKHGDKKLLLKSKKREFISSVNTLLDAPEIIFPDVPLENPFLASPSGMTKDELALLKRIRALSSPGAPNPFWASPSGMTNDELVLLKHIRALSSPGAPNISPLNLEAFPQYAFITSPELDSNQDAFITSPELDAKRLKLLNPVIAGEPVVFE